MLNDTAVADEDVDNIRWSSYVLESGNHVDNVYLNAWLPRILACSTTCPPTCRHARFSTRVIECEYVSLHVYVFCDAFSVLIVLNHMDMANITLGLC